MELKWHEEARLEADAAAAFYKTKRPGLEQRFLDSLEDALRRIRGHPRAYRRIEAELRKCRLPHFPYGVVYRVQSNHFTKKGRKIPKQDIELAKARLKSLRQQLRG